MEDQFSVKHYKGDAVALPPVEELTEDLEEKFLLHCPVCECRLHSQQRCPQLLACGHLLCSPCVQQAKGTGGVRCQQCSPVRLVSGEPAPDRVLLELLELIQSSGSLTDSGRQQGAEIEPDLAARFLTDLSEKLLTCELCKIVYDDRDRRAVVLPCQHQLCSRCERKMAKKECPFCRKTFPPQPLSDKKALLDLLLEWLRPFVPAVPALASSLSLDHMCSLQDRLQEAENAMKEALRLDPVVMAQRETLNALLGNPLSPIELLLMADTFNSDEVDSKTRSFAETCVEVIKEVCTLDYPTSKEVWSTVRIALEKMEQYITVENPLVRKALFQADAVTVLLQCCDNQQFLDQLSPENQIYMNKTSWVIVLKIALMDEMYKQLRLQKSFLEVVIRHVKVDTIETGWTHWALQLIHQLFVECKDKQSLANQLAELGFVARCADICRVASDKESFKSDKLKEIVKRVHHIFQSCTYNSNAFALAVINAGLLEYLLEICKTPVDASKEDEADIFITALNIVDNLGRFSDLHQHLMEKRTANVLMPLTGLKNEGLRMLVMFVLAQISRSEEEIRNFLEHFNENGTLLTAASWTEKALSSEDRTFHYPGCGGIIYPSDFLEFLCRIAQLPGQQLKILESKWPELLCRLLEEGKEKEKGHVINCLLTLSESPDVQPHLAENEAVVRGVRAVQESGPSSLSQPASLLLSRLLPHASPSPEEEIRNEP